MTRNPCAQFARDFGALVGASRVRSFARARHALLILLKSLGVAPGHRVGVCAFSCVAVTEAVKLAGASPVYLDVDRSACIDPAEILRCAPGSLKAVILQHTFGMPGNLGALLDACRTIRAHVVEDCAHVMSGSWQGAPLGSFGAGAVFSAGWGKPWPLGRGGLLAVNSDDLLASVDAQIAQWALPESFRSRLVAAGERWTHGAFVFAGARRALLSIDAQLYIRGLRVEPSELASGFRLRPGYVRSASPAFCNLALKRLPAWPAIRAKRVANVERIESRLAQAGLPLWPQPARASSVLFSYPVWVADKPRAMTLAQRQRVHLLGYYETPVHPLWNDSLAQVGYRLGSCPRAEALTDHLVHISTLVDDINPSLDLLTRLNP